MRGTVPREWARVRDDRADLTHRYRVEYLIVDPTRPAPAVRRELAASLESEADAGVT